MKPSAFEYHRPQSVEEAAELLGEYGDEAKVLAGGQSLVPMLAMRLAVFGHLIDVSRIEELQGIGPAEAGSVEIGAATVDARLERDADLALSVPLLPRITPFIGHFQIRNRGTIGGSIAHADPAAEYPAVTLALDAELTARSSRGERTIAAQDFFDGLWTTTLAPDELLTSVSFPVWSGRSGFGVAEFARRHGDFAIAGAVAAVQLDDGGGIRRVAVGLFGLGPTPLRAGRLEQEVAGRPLADCPPDQLGALAVADLDEVTSDTVGSAAYRKRVGAAMTARAWARAASEAQAARSAEEVHHA